MVEDDFSDDLGGTPTEADLDELYGSKYLGAVSIGDKKIRTRIGKVRKETMPQQGGKPGRAKFVIYFTTLDKPMVLNATNKNVLVEKLGKVPANWVDAEVGLYTENTQFGGKQVKGLRLRVLGPAKTAATTGKAAPAKPAKPATPAKSTEEKPWPDDPDDPGFSEAAE
jgi:hypothetical protein